MSRQFKPGVYPDINELDYHSGVFGPKGGSLSSTDAKRILEAPAIYKYWHDNPQPAKSAYEFGHIVHALVLGTGLDIEIIPDELLSANGAATTKAAREFTAAARERGAIPVKSADLEAPRALAEAVKAHPVAGPIFKQGKPEVSIFAQHETGLWMRGRIDWVTHSNDATMLVDLKTTASAVAPEDFSREAARFDYAVQREWYRQIWEQVTGETAPLFVHVVVSKTPPYLVGVYEFDSMFEEAGRNRVAQALDIYTACKTADSWPGYTPDEIELVGPPTYYYDQNTDD